MRAQAKVYLLAEARVSLLREKPRSGLSCLRGFSYPKAGDRYPDCAGEWELSRSRLKFTIPPPMI